MPRVLYLGDWADAEAHERLDELNVKRRGRRRSVCQTCMPTLTTPCMRVPPPAPEVYSLQVKLACFEATAEEDRAVPDRMRLRPYGACCRVLTIHNNPENLRLPPRFQRLSFTLADVDTQDVSPFFAPAYDFIEAARAAREGAYSSYPRGKVERVRKVEEAQRLLFRVNLATTGRRGE